MNRLTRRKRAEEPADSLDLLEFTKVAARLAGLTRTAPGRSLALALRPLAEPDTIATALAEAAEAMRLLAEQGELPLGDVDDLQPLLDGLCTDGMRLPVAAFGGTRDVMKHLAPLGAVYPAGTLSGNPVAVACGLATLRLIQAPGF